MATQRENAFCAFEDIAKTACKGAVSFRIPPSSAQGPLPSSCQLRIVKPLDFCQSDP